MLRRRLLQSALTFPLALSLLTAPAIGMADWPEKPVRILVSFPPGGASDLVARLLAEKLSSSLGQQFVVENKPGAAGTVAATALKEAQADGYTLMLSNLTPFSVAPTRFPDTPYDPVEDFEHITYIGTVHLGLFASAELDADDLASFVDSAKDKPGEYEYGSSGVGSWGHIIAEHYQDLSDTELFHIPYKGSSPMRLDFRSGVVPTIFDAVPQNLPAVEEGTAIALAVSSRERLATLPDTPTFMELGYEVVAENWLGISSPAGLPEPIMDTLDTALQQAMSSEEVMSQFESWGLVREAMSREAFSEYVATQFVDWKPLVLSVSN